MAGWIKMPLGMQVGLSPDDIVLDGDPTPTHQKGGHSSPHICGPCLLWPNSWMDSDATWYEGMPWLRRLCVRWGPSFLCPLERAQQPPIFVAYVYCGHGRPSQLLLSSCYPTQQDALLWSKWLRTIKWATSKPRLPGKCICSFLRL